MEAAKIGRMPTFGKRDEPVSVLAARAARAGLIRRHAQAMQRLGAGAERRDGHVIGRLHERGVPPTGLRPPELAAFFRRWWPVVRVYTDTDRFRAESLLSVLWQVRGVAGDIVECGSYRGGLGFLFALAVKDWGLGKKVRLYDSFEGLPALSDEDRGEGEKSFFYPGQFRGDDLLAGIRAFLDEHGLADIVEVHKGWFEETLPLAEQPICFAHIDCDLYRSAQTCFTYLVARAPGGAAVVVDDYDSFGMYRATWEFLARMGWEPLVYVGALKQGHFFTPSPSGPTTDRVADLTTGAAACGDHRVGARPEDWSPLLSNRPYCAYLAALFAEMILVCSGPADDPLDAQLQADLDRILGPGEVLPFLERFIAYLYPA